MATVYDKSNPGSKLDKSQDSSRIPLTPSDTVKQPVTVDAVFVGAAGNIVVDDGNGGRTTIAVDIGGPQFLGGVSYIYATGTTATGLVGLASKALR